MPFKSKTQMRWMFKNEPAMARRWAKETPNEKGLPERAPKPKARGKASKAATGKGRKR
jgi:hypothetical protein